MRKSILNWRVWSVEPSGLVVWFDPSMEFLRLYSLPEQRSVAQSHAELEPGLDREGVTDYLDKVGSVSASEAEARALSGNEELDQLDLLPLTCPPQGVMLNHG